MLRSAAVGNCYFSSAQTDKEHKDLSISEALEGQLIKTETFLE